MNRMSIAFLVLFAVIGSLVPFGVQSHGAEKQLVIATSTMGGAYYPIGGKLAGLWSRVIPGLTVTAQVTAGGVENVRLLSQGKVEIGFIPSDTAYSASNGLPPFVDKDKKQRPIDVDFFCNINASGVHMLVLKDSPIRTFRDLKGKKVAVGAPGSSVEQRSRFILEAYGYKYDRDVTPIFVGAEESTQILKDQLADAVCLTSGIPTAAVMDIATFKPIKMISLDEEIIGKILKDSPYLMKFTIPQGTYKGIDQDVITVASTGSLYLMPKMEPDIAYKLAKATFENGEEIRDSHGSTKGWTKEFAIRLKMTKFHPGVEKYLKEIGLVK
jgi:TRAP transporter TAXI family solute receptor